MPTKFNKTAGSVRQHSEREENPNISESRTMRDKVHAISNVKTEQQYANADLAGNYKRNSNKKAFKGNWSSEEVNFLICYRLTHAYCLPG